MITNLIDLYQVQVVFMEYIRYRFSCIGVDALCVTDTPTRSALASWVGYARGGRFGNAWGEVKRRGGVGGVAAERNGNGKNEKLVTLETY